MLRSLVSYFRRVLTLWVHLLAHSSGYMFVFFLPLIVFSKFYFQEPARYWHVEIDRFSSSQECALASFLLLLIKCVNCYMIATIQISYNIWRRDYNESSIGANCKFVTQLLDYLFSLWKCLADFFPWQFSGRTVLAICVEAVSLWLVVLNSTNGKYLVTL